MKKLIILATIVFGTISSKGQIVVSSCDASDSITAKYKKDADRLALRKIYRQNLTYKDSVCIPTTHSAPVLDALLAVYNATVLPARDTVISMFDIHTFPTPEMSSLIVAADSNLIWMKQLKVGNIPTGYSTVDSLMSRYNLTVGSYSTNFYIHSYHSIVFATDSNYNLLALANLFNAMPGVVYTDPNSRCCDGNNIKDSIYSSHIELVYSRGWGDCMAGCMARRSWKFNIYPDCSVQFIGSYGNTLIITDINNIDKKDVSISPNPFNNFINIKGISQPYKYTISNILGQELTKGESTNNSLTELERINPGLYILKIQEGSETTTFKIMKE